MLTRFLSIVTFTGLLYTYVLSQLNSNDILFFVGSNNMILNLVLLLLAAAAVYMSFTNKFSRSYTYLLTAVLSPLFIVLGLIGIIYAGQQNSFVVVGPLDFVVMTELGVMYGIYGLTRRHSPVEWRLPNYHYSSKKYVLGGWMPLTKTAR